jgi:succinate dehydrogenase / fumarate reductase membrane anchor subunit
MSLRSPLGRVLGLGAAKDGVGHWWAQRLTAVALVPLTLWFFGSLLSLGSLDYAVVRHWLAVSAHALGVLLLLITLVYHSRLGLQVVVEDYVHTQGVKLVTLVAIDFLHILIAGSGVFAVLEVIFGGSV